MLEECSDSVFTDESSSIVNVEVRLIARHVLSSDGGNHSH